MGPARRRVLGFWPLGFQAAGGKAGPEIDAVQARALRGESGRGLTARCPGLQGGASVAGASSAARGKLLLAQLLLSVLVRPASSTLADFTRASIRQAPLLLCAMPDCRLPSRRCRRSWRAVQPERLFGAGDTRPYPRTSSPDRQAACGRLCKPQCGAAGPRPRRCSPGCPSSCGGWPRSECRWASNWALPGLPPTRAGNKRTTRRPSPPWRLPLPLPTCRAAADVAGGSRPRGVLGGAAAAAGAAAGAAAAYSFAAQPVTAHAEAPWQAEKGKGGDLTVSALADGARHAACYATRSSAAAPPRRYTTLTDRLLPLRSLVRSRRTGTSGPRRRSCGAACQRRLSCISMRRAAWRGAICIASMDG